MSTDVTSELREALADALDLELDSLGISGEVSCRASDYLADAVLALPAVRDALAAQEKLRSYANDPAPTSEQLRDLVIRNRELEATVRRVEELADRLADEWDEGDDEFCSGQVAGLRDAADRLRRALDGDS